MSAQRKYDDPLQAAIAFAPVGCLLWLVIAAGSVALFKWVF